MRQSAMMLVTPINEHKEPHKSEHSCYCGVSDKYEASSHPDSSGCSEYQETGDSIYVLINILAGRICSLNRWKRKAAAGEVSPLTSYVPPCILMTNDH